MKKSCLILYIFLLILLTACRMPQRDPEAVLTMQAETSIAGMVLTLQTDFPTVTPTPTATATRTPTPTATITLTPTCTIDPNITPTATLGPEFFHGSLSYEVEFVSQEGLKYKGREINTGCTAASLQMVLEFWHQYKEDYPVMSAQKLLDRNAQQGNLNPGSGLNITQTKDELAEMDYYLGTRMDSNQSELLEALERYGPLLILTKVNWTPFGANHMAVVSGYDTEEDIITVMDPWVPGGVMKMKYDSFDGIWGLNYMEDDTDTLRRTFFFVIPYCEMRSYDELFVPNFENPHQNQLSTD